MTLSLIQGGLDAAPVQLPPTTPPSDLELALDTIYSIAAGLEMKIADQRAAQLGLVAAVRLDHDDHHDCGWAVCASPSCKLAGAMTPG